MCVSVVVVYCLSLLRFLLFVCIVALFGCMCFVVWFKLALCCLCRCALFVNIRCVVYFLCFTCVAVFVMCLCSSCLVVGLA